jgi:hypothetical protein
VTGDVVPEGGWYRNYGDANSRPAVQTGEAHSGLSCLRLEASTIPAEGPTIGAEQAIPARPGPARPLSA